MFALTEIFETIQGEGVFVGTPAMFIRFAGCNMWSGTDATRARDAQRNGAHCPLFCDTDFIQRMKLTTEEIVSAAQQWRDKRGRLVVLTGGEPLLQVTSSLLKALLAIMPYVAIETNGTVPLPAGVSTLLSPGLWVTCSPKRAPERLLLDPADVSELKVVYPTYDPAAYAAWLKPSAGRAAMFVQAAADPLPEVGNSLINQDNTRRAIQWCLEHPEWRLSTQTHKILGLR